MARRQSGAPLRPPPPNLHQRPVVIVEDPRLLRRPPPPLGEDRIAANHREIQALLLDNQRLAATHVALKRDLSIADQELRQIAAAARQVSEERDGEVKEVYERSLKIEAEVRAIDALNAELAEVRSAVRKLTENKIELTAQLKAVDAELARAKLEAREVPAVRVEIESMHQELQKGRAAIEFEKKTRAANLEHSRMMEKNMTSMQQEIERLRAELANAEKRSRAVAAAAASNPNPGIGYMGHYGSPNMAFGGSPYPAQYAMHQAQTAAVGAPPGHYGPVAGSHGPVDMRQTHVPKG